ncbi:proton channel OtopLc isoform X4 [Phlebotomus papatasi]|uniref:proton channel OtopLc isoform X4 n=1 Tax=Phlebotomus papatasi TaxID=29031 RepID=UPI002483AC24|nr:proton channel OtopLc isoform X4 [Phlebotomus papatasi]
MQRCPYIHEMRERLLPPQQPSPPLQQPLQFRHHVPHQHPPTPRPIEPPAAMEQEREGLLLDSRPTDGNQLNPDGYGSHTSPTHQRTPLVPRDLGEDFSLDYAEEPLDPRRPKNANTFTKDIGFYIRSQKRTSLFIVTSLVYAMLLVVVCVAYVISDVSTHRIPVMYYEGFFTYLYGASILFLLYVFCFLLQESTCCAGGEKQPKPVKEKKPKEKKPKKGDPPEGKDAKGGKDKDKDAAKGGKPSPFQTIKFNFQDTTVEAEKAPTPKNVRKRKTTQNNTTHGSFFLRVGAIAFGLGTMIYTGLEFGSFFEIPFDSPCHQILRGVNPLLQMIFTFMQMYFIFMNARLNIHRFKVLARFGLMHIVATNICVWIRTLVLESLKEITLYHQRRGPAPEDGAILDSIRRHTLRNAGTVMGTHLEPDFEWEPLHSNMNVQEASSAESPANILSRIVKSTAQGVTEGLAEDLDNPTPSRTTTSVPVTTLAHTTTTFLRKLKRATSAPTTESTETTTTAPPVTSTSTLASIFALFSSSSTTTSTPAPTTTTTSTTTESFFNNLFGFDQHSYQTYSGLAHNTSNSLDQTFESLDSLFPSALTAFQPVNYTNTTNATACGRVNIMGTIVQDSAPYLYPFIIEYCLIGAVVIYVMWRQIGRYPKFATEEDLEHRLEVMLSRRAVAMAQASSGRVDCVGASKGLFFGLLLLVGSLICLILFFVLVRHPQLSLLAIYLADVSHSALMAFSVIAILIGFCRVQHLKFRCEDQSNLNDILLRISAFGLFTYSVFSVISGALNFMESEPNLLVCVTGALAVLQVIFQLLFIADVSRRRVHLPEHDRSKPGRQIVTFLLICNISMFAIYTFEAQKVFANPVQLDFYGFIAWSLIQRVTLPLCIFHRFHSAVTLAEVWKTTYKPRLE